MSRPTPSRLLLALVAMAAAGDIHAEVGDPLQLRLDYQVTRDANLFRLPKELPPSSEVIEVLSAGLMLDKALSRQSLRARLTTSAYRYQDHASLNFDAVNLQGEWQWRVGSDWSGLVSYGQAETPGSYEELQSQQLRVYKIRQRNRGLTVNYRLGPATSLWAGASQYQRESSLLASDRVRNAVHEVGVRVASAAGTSVGISYRDSKTEYPDRQTVGGTAVDNGFGDQELRLTAHWAPSGKTTFDGWVSRFRRRHNELPERDVSGVQARVAANWAATGQVALSGELWRTLSPIEQQTANYTLNTGAGLSAIWSVSAKLAVRGKITREERDYRGDPGYFLAAGPRRRDTLFIPEVGLDYRVRHNAGLAVRYQAPERRSNQSFTGYEDSILTFSAFAQF